jgi:hypothetical protein
MQTVEPGLLLMKLTAIINSPSEPTQNKQRAIDMMMKHYRMFGNDTRIGAVINIQSVLD